MRHIIKTVAILAISVVIGYLLLVLAFCLPDGRIRHNVINSASSFNGEYHYLIHDNIMTKTDDFTDAIMLMTASDTSDRNPFTEAIYAYHTEREDAGPNEVIRDLNSSENHQVTYSRYWHGYLLLLRPLLIFFNYSQIQVLISFIVVALVIIVAYLLQKKGLTKYIIPYSVAIAMMFPMTISLSLQYISVFGIFNVFMIVILLYFDRLLERKNYFYLFLIIGMLTCYFDFLTYPVVTLGIPLLIWLLLLNKKEKKSNVYNLKQVLIGTAAWCIGYFGIWVGKWSIGSLVTGRNLFSSAMDAANSRASVTMSSEEITRFFPISEAFNKIFSEPFLFVILILVVVFVFLIVRKKIVLKKQEAFANLWMFAIMMIPLLWFMVLANHSAWHLFFTYRTMSVLIFAIGCYIMSIIGKNDNSRGKKDG